MKSNIPSNSNTSREYPLSSYQINLKALDRQRDPFVGLVSRAMMTI
jgi:hypothetical protein